MKFATIALLGILLLASLPSMKAADPAGAGQVALAFTGVPVSTTNCTDGDVGCKEPYICIWYPLLVGDLNGDSLFAPWSSSDGTPPAGKEHAYLIWVSDYSAQLLPSYDGVFTFMLVPTGTATIYFRLDPGNRIWDDLTKRGSWGDPVAKFVRKAGIFQSTDPDGYSGTLISSAELVSSKPFKLNGKTFNFKDLIPQGMTCFETGVGEAEAGTCVAIGK
jgi:hypothetical protein